MEQFYIILSMVTAGVSLAGGLINLTIGFHRKGTKTELLFGIACLLVFIFLVAPPVGFILVDKAPYPTAIIVKRIFIFAYYILLPWFIESYSNYRQRVFTYSIGLLFGISYVVMALTSSASAKPGWLMLALLPFFLIFCYGLLASYKQNMAGNTTSGKWLMWAIIAYGLLLFAGNINQLGNNFFGRMMGTNLFFPIHLQLLAFITIMSVRLITNNFEKFRLEKILSWGDIRWNSVVDDMELLLVELDMNGNIKHLNRYALRSLGLRSEGEVIGKNWFENFRNRDEMAASKSLYLEAFKTGKILPYTNTHIISSDGNDLFINWTNVFTYNDKVERTGTLSIGLNVTEREQAFKEVQFLKSELEKENLVLKGMQLAESTEDNIIGQSKAILYAIQKAKQVAPTNAAVLLEGETGVGKELFASLIHKCSYRADKPFIKVNCAALPAELIESELFGHEKGSFTGAHQSRKGRFEMANGGTIFLDEIGELSISLQSKLLRVLQNGEFERIGSQQTIKVDVRLISATNRDLLGEVRDHHFREDLYYRLDVYPITIPPLRKRKEDLPLLLNYYVRKLNDEHHKIIENISKADMTRLTEYSWPGNVRELINVLERSIISSSGNTLKLEWQRPAIEPLIPMSMDEMDKAHILKVLNGCGWKINGPDGAAEILGLNPNTLRSRLKKLNIVRNQE